MVIDLIWQKLQVEVCFPSSPYNSLSLPPPFLLSSSPPLPPLPPSFLGCTAPQQQSTGNHREDSEASQEEVQVDR